MLIFQRYLVRFSEWMVTSDEFSLHFAADRSQSLLVPFVKTDPLEAPLDILLRSFPAEYELFDETHMTQCPI